MVQTLVVLGHCVNKMYKHYDVIMFGHRDLKIVMFFYLNIGSTYMYVVKLCMS